MGLSPAEFRKALVQDATSLSDGRTPAGIFACSDCRKPLQETVTGNRPCSDGRCLCSDCYFDEFGRELEAHPITAFRVARGA